MRVVATSDWHLDRSTSGFSRFDDVRRAVLETVDQALRLRADLYLMLGDLCDPGSKRLPRAVAFAISVGLELQAQGILTAWLPGNHDVVEDGSGDHAMLPLAAAGLQVLDKPGLVPLGGLNVVALPFTPTSHTYNPAEVIEEVAGRGGAGPLLVAGHLCAEGAEPGSETEDMPRGRDVFWPWAAIRAKLPGAIMVGGHYHRRQVVDGVHMVGSLERLTHGEEGNRPGFMVLEVVDG